MSSNGEARSVKVGETTFLLPFVDEIPFHADDDAALGAAISLANRIKEPVVCWKQKSGGGTETVIDGAHRVLHAATLGLDVPIRYERCEDEEAARQLCHELNDDRRQQDRNEITKRRKQRIDREVEARNAGESLRTIAEKEGVSSEQVRRDLEAASTVTGG